MESPLFATDAREEERKQLRLDVAVMRELGCTHWRDIELGPPAATPTDSTQQRITDEEEARRRRAYQRELAERASGGPVKRLDGNIG